MNGLDFPRKCAALSVSRKIVYNTTNRYKELGTLNDRPGRGRHATATSGQKVKCVCEMVRRNPKRSLRKIAKVIGNSRSSITRIVKRKKGLKFLRCQKGHILLLHMMENRQVKYTAIIQRLGEARYRDITFSDEKIFTIEAPLNRQNNRVLAKSLAETDEV
ncbi:unnamed protein product [Nippostrongylus brasiliensis]|uniref:Transposase n=1 Tax=Nippostrongylus brasiliensis TaxID=27835 RepID=A0A0N4YQL1_NIPBR|nr:unnamed protein product [Nippostrongylus brasiliensis]